MLKIGLTGSIGSGKTAILNLLQEKGFFTINLDEEAKKLLNKNTPEHEKVIAFFGKNLLNKEEDIDKKLLADEIFSDYNKKKALEGIIYPALKESVLRILKVNKKSTAIIEGAVIIESGFYSELDKIVLVTCDFAKRLERSCGRFSSDDFTKRDQSQLSQSEKLKKSHFIINNNYGFKFLISQVDLLSNYINNINTDPS